MATYFVASGGSNTAPYDTWAKAATSLATALAAATASGDIIVIQYDAVPSGDAQVSADTTYTFAGHVALISASNDGGSAWTPTAMGTANWIGNSTAGRSVTLNGGFRVRTFGLTLRTAGSSSDNIVVIGGDNSHYEHEEIYLWSGNTSASPGIIMGDATNSRNSYLKLVNPTIRFGATGQRCEVRQCAVDIVGGSVSSAGSAPTTLLNLSGGVVSGGSLSITGADLSLVTGPLVADNTSAPRNIIFDNCKLGSSFTVLATQTPANMSACRVWMFNCAGADTHYNFGYYDAFGQVESVTNITATDAAANNKYDGTNRCSWKIVTTANCSYWTPFVTPWFEKFHDGVSAITPSIEALTDGSSTALKDDEIWGEWSYQGTTGYPLASFVNDRRALAATAANQATSSLGAGDWSGEGGTNWYGKLAPASPITPAEIGMLRARVCVGKASTTVYIDPTVRVA